MKRHLAFPITLLLMLTTLGLPLGAQTESADSQDQIVLKRLTYIQWENVASALGLFKLDARPTHQNTLMLKGPPDEVARALEVIENLDIPPVPRRRLEVYATLLEAKRDGSADQPLPESLRTIGERLESLFGYRSVRVLDQILMTATEGNHAALEGGVTLDPRQDEKGYSLEFRPRVIDREGVTAIQLEGLSFAIFAFTPDPSTPPEARNSRLVAFSTSVDLEEGQTAVVGKASPAVAEGNLVLVVRAEVLD